MKRTMNPRAGLMSLAGAVSVALLVPALAIEKPAGQDAPKEKAAKAPAAGQAENAPKAAEAGKPAQKVAMLGVGGMTASETLSLHLGLEQGTGLTLYHIVPGSAAEKAGLERHDILTEFDCKKIGSQQDLRDAVQAKKPGDEVTLKYIRKGKGEEKKVVLGEREQAPEALPAPGINPEWLQKNLGGNMPPAGIIPMDAELMKHFRQQMQQLQNGQGDAMKLDLGKLLKQAQKGGKNGGLMNFGFGTSITLMDNDGSITMQTRDGKKEVTVKDKAGKTLFEGPYQTEQDKAAVPEEIRERIERLNIGDGANGLDLRIMPPMNVPPAEDAGQDPAE